MLKVFSDANEAGIIGNIQYSVATGLIDHAGMFIDQNGIPKHARKNTNNIPQKKYTEWSCITTACCLIKKTVFMQMGGFDERFQNGCEDIDLCLRLREQGYRCYAANESIIYHHISCSPGRNSDNGPNVERFLQKWSGQTIELAKAKWTLEYLLRYRRHWWKNKPLESIPGYLPPSVQSQQSRLRV